VTAGSPLGDESAEEENSMKISLSMKLLAATASLVAVLSAERAEAGQQSCGNLRQTETSWSTGLNQNVNSTTRVDVQGSNANFTVGGSGNSCVIVRIDVLAAVFSDAPSGQILSLIAIMDGGTIFPVNAIAEIQTPQFAFSGTGNFPVTTSADFIFPAVSPGPHTVKIEAAASFPNANQDGPESTISDFSMIIAHR
jgi:hypothetical protein